MSFDPSVPNAGNPPVHCLVFSASLRQDSLNTRLARLAAQIIAARGGAVDFAAMAEFDCPSYNQDVEDNAGFPAGAHEFRRRILANDAFVVVSPEYNCSVPGILKNAVDWLSRYRPQPFNTKHGLLLSASPSMVGGNRGLWALRVPLEHLGARVFPDMFSLAQAHQAFDADGQLVNAQLTDRLTTTIAAFMDLVEAARHYPCAKKAWFEFLGEQPTLATGRVD
jgi:NAD(P)H-dependent FMN reductase